MGGCTSDEFKRVGYEAAYNSQCMHDTGPPNCDPEHMAYDEYIKTAGGT